MICYECQQAGKTRDTVALCHHCSAALCPEHALILSDPVTAQYPVCQTVVLPLRARVFLCGTCREALRQTIEDAHKGPDVTEVAPTAAAKDSVSSDRSEDRVARS
jgi:hypothetical protein